MEFGALLVQCAGMQPEVLQQPGDLPAFLHVQRSEDLLLVFDQPSRNLLVLLERLQERTAKDPRGVDYPEINLRADGAGLRVRRVLRGRLAADNR